MFYAVSPLTTPVTPIYCNVTFCSTYEGPCRRIANKSTNINFKRLSLVYGFYFFHKNMQEGVDVSWFAFANICTNNKYADVGFIYNFPQDWPHTNGRTFEQRKSTDSYIQLQNAMLLNQIFCFFKLSLKSNMNVFPRSNSPYNTFFFQTVIC